MNQPTQPLLYAQQQNNRLLSLFLQAVDAPPTLDTSVHRQDEMFAYALSTCHNSWNDALVHYHLCGLWGWQVVDQLLATTQATERRWLDFGCGYGRVLRWARASDPTLEVTACEIDAQAVDFVAAQFGVNGRRSKHDPTRFDTSQRYALVTAQSVFTHLPEARFHSWLEALWQCVDEGGMLCLSTNDLAAAPEALRDGQHLVFERHSESEHLDQDAYGTTWVDTQWMRQLATAVGGEELGSIEHVQRGIWNAQDLWILRRRSPAKSSASTEAALTPAPFGYLEGVELLDSTRVKVEGWCLAQPAEHIRDPPLEIAVQTIDGHRLACSRSTPLSPRDDLLALYGAHLAGGRFSVTLVCSAAISGLEALSITINGWPIHFSLLDAADRRIRTARQIEELEVGQRILKTELERKGGIPLRFARAVLKRLRR